MKYFILILLTVNLSATKFLNAQVIINPQRYSLTTIDQLEWLNPTRISSSKSMSDIAGTPYLHEEFKNGVVYYDRKLKIDRIPLRLNLYNDQLEYKKNEVILAFGNPDRIDKVILEGETFIYIPKSPLYKLSGFVKMWSPGWPSVVTKMKIDFFKEKPLEPIEIPKPDRFERVADRHYIMKSGHEIKKAGSLKKIIKYLGAHHSELSKFAKEHNISSNDPEDLMKLLSYFQELEGR
jgi:hypothetical protein